MTDLKSIDNPVGVMSVEPAPGDVLITLSGRQTTPYPVLSGKTGTEITKSRRAYQNWLLSNAIEEAELKGDSFNLRMFQAEFQQLNTSKSLLPPASVDVAEMYLFEDQPQLVKSILDALDANKAKVEVQTITPPQGDMFGRKQDGFDPDVLLQITADSWELLRKQDVMRLVESGVNVGSKQLDQLISRMMGVRSDLRDEIRDCLTELSETIDNFKFGPAAAAVMSFSEDDADEIEGSEVELLAAAKANDDLSKDMKLLEELGEEGLLAEKHYGTLDRLRRQGLILDDKEKDKKSIQYVIGEIDPKNLEGSNHEHILDQILAHIKYHELNGLEYLTINQFLANVEVGEIKGARLSHFKDELVKYRDLSGAVKAGRIHWKSITGHGGSIALANNMLSVRIKQLENIIQHSPLFDPQIAESYLKCLRDSYQSQTMQISEGQEDGTDSLVLESEGKDLFEPSESILDDEIKSFSTIFKTYARQVHLFVRRDVKVPESITNQIYMDQELDQNELNVLMDYAERKIPTIPGWEPPTQITDINGRDLRGGNLVYSFLNGSFFEYHYSVEKTDQNEYLNFHDLENITNWSSEIPFSYEQAKEITDFAFKYADELGHDVSPYHLKIAKGVVLKSFDDLEVLGLTGEVDQFAKLFHEYTDIKLGRHPKDIMVNLSDYCGIDFKAYELENLKIAMERESDLVIRLFANGKDIVEVYKERIQSGYNILDEESGKDKYLRNKSIDQGFNLSVRGVRYSEISKFIKATIAWDKAHHEYELSKISTDELLAELKDVQAPESKSSVHIMDKTDIEPVDSNNPEIYYAFVDGMWEADLTSIAMLDHQAQRRVYEMLSQDNQHTAALRVRAMYVGANSSIQNQLRDLDREVNKHKNLTPRLQYSERILSAELDKLDSRAMDFPKRVLLNVISNGNNLLTDYADIEMQRNHFRIGAFRDSESNLFLAAITKGYDSYLTENHPSSYAAVASLYELYNDRIDQVFSSEHGISANRNILSALCNVVESARPTDFVEHLSNKKVLDEAVLVRVTSGNVVTYSMITDADPNPIKLSEAQQSTANSVWEGIRELNSPSDSYRAAVSYKTGLFVLDNLQSIAPVDVDEERMESALAVS